MHSFLIFTSSHLEELLFHIDPPPRQKRSEHDSFLLNAPKQNIINTKLEEYRYNLIEYLIMKPLNKIYMHICIPVPFTELF